ncbi:NAD(P)/FAD-dependent oxidoreductase [Desulfopila inferna]|uniref:NAD(P)/FAD-dependent oxidoreductase n=1 Tax=Desulfopila inferna TaxID=468528 RepID=UPI001964D654|nr:FAD-dependent oxidoreductase [Desulfopila inferna]MBM9606659.1 FAD-dependent oxidoreductase [Desulfopila inferna]
MSKKLVLAGGGHAHMKILANLRNLKDAGYLVTVIQPSAYHYYSGMGPGMLSTHYSPDQIRFKTRFVVERQGCRFFKAKVTGINADQKTVLTDTGETIPYDVLSCNVGSYVPSLPIEGSSKNIFSAKPIERLLEAQQKIIAKCNSNSIAIGVIGGGPAAVEIAGNAYHLVRTTGCKNITIRLFAGKKLMEGYSRSIQKIIRKTFQHRDIIIDESGYAAAINDGTIILENGQRFSSDIIFLAIGTKPSPLFADSGLATGPDGGLLVNEFLQATENKSILGGGDCISFSPEPLDKVGVYAVRQNPVLLHNIQAVLNNVPLKKFQTGGKYLLIFNLGEKIGALQKGPITWGGKSAFFIKDYIDKKFMHRFQALEK